MERFEHAKKLIDSYVKEHEGSFEEIVEMGVKRIDTDFDIFNMKDDERLETTILGVIASYSYIEELTNKKSGEA